MDVHKVPFKVGPDGLSLLTWDHDPRQGPETFIRYEDGVSAVTAPDLQIPLREHSRYSLPVLILQPWRLIGC
jgi:hypothetical protein